MYHISTISDILRQGVDSLAQWLEHWISTPAVRVRIPSGTWDFLSSELEANPQNIVGLDVPVILDSFPCISRSTYHTTCMVPLIKAKTTNLANLQVTQVHENMTVFWQGLDIAMQSDNMHLT